MRLGRTGVSEGLRKFVEEMPYERGPIFDFVRRAADRLPPGSVVADVGAGNAPYRELFEHTRYITIDWEKSVHEGAAQSDIIAPADQLPVDDGAFDAVLLTQVLEHVPDPARVLAEIHRTLKPGGVLVLTAPLVWELHETPFDFYRYTTYGLQHLLQQAGFEAIDVVPRNDSFTTIAQLLRNVSWTFDPGEPAANESAGRAAATLRQLADEIAAFAPLDRSRLLPLGYSVTARRA
jgi:SAM-dependent methyltransferase